MTSPDGRGPAGAVGKHARARAVAAFVVAAVIGGFGIAILPISSVDPALVVYCIVAILLGLLAAALGAVAIAITRDPLRTPGPRTLNTVLGWAIFAVVVLGIATAAVTGGRPLAVFGFGILMACLGAVVGLLCNGNRHDLTVGQR